MKLIPWNGLAINSARNILSFLVLLIFFRISRHRLVINKTVLIGAIAITGTNILYGVAKKLTTAGNTIILQVTMPIWVMIFSSLLLKKKRNLMLFWPKPVRTRSTSLRKSALLPVWA